MQAVRYDDVNGDVNAAQHARSSSKTVVLCISQPRVTLPKLLAGSLPFHERYAHVEEGRNPGPRLVGSRMQSSGHSRTLRLRLRLSKVDPSRSRRIILWIDREGGLSGGSMQELTAARPKWADAVAIRYLRAPELLAS